MHQILLGSYTFVDADANSEGESIMKWYRIVGGTPMEIAEANAISYPIVDEDLGYPLAFEITPVDQHGMAGAPVMSEPTLPIEALPAPANFQAVLNPPNNVILSWERPPHFDGEKGFVGYRIFRGGLNISTITNPNTLGFADTYVPDGTHEYWICSLFNNPMELSEPSNIVTVVVGGNSTDDPAISPAFNVSASPNPFTNSTSIQIKSAAHSNVNLKLFNLKGQQLHSWDLKADAAGNAIQNLDAMNMDSGVYFYRMESSGKTLTGKLIRIK